MIAIGHLFGYGLGTINLLNVFGTTLGDSQFKQLCLIAAFTLLIAVSVTSLAVEERVLVSTRYTYSCYTLSQANAFQRRRCEVRRCQNGQQDPQNDVAFARPNTSYLLGPILGLDR